MVELLRSNDMAHLSWVRAMLEGAGIDCLQLDEHMSALEGSIGAIPRRILVEESDLEAARRLLAEAAGTDHSG
ncbi:MAG: DUF2007 domain-containing protein [Geminicoccaceae bacterium]